MSDRPLRPCAGGCGTLVIRGRCVACAHQQDRQRATASTRGYDRTWSAFRQWWLGNLVHRHGLLPVCGARFPDGPLEEPTACQAADQLTYTSPDGSSLHLDHVPELADWERTRPDLVCDPRRIVLKCSTCHNRKTAIAAARARTNSGGVV